MGCLPVIALFVVGSGIGWWLGGDIGALWGAGLGIGVGIIAGLIVVFALRRQRTGKRSGK